MESVKYLLDEDQIPKSWYNILADLPVPLPPVIHPGTKQPIGPNDLAPLFPMDLILQEVSTEREIPIPEPVRDIYRLWRPTPLHRARGWNECWIRPRTFTINMKVRVPPEATSRIPLWRRPSTTSRPACAGWRPRQAPGNGEAPWPWPAACSICNAPCAWSRSAMTRSLTARS